MAEDPRLELAEIAASGGTVRQRAEAMLHVLHRLVPFDGAWLALADPLGGGYQSLASAALDEATVQFLSGPLMARDIATAGTDRHRPPLRPSDQPYSVEQLRAWADCLVPAGYHEALAVALFAPGGRHVGFLALLSGSKEPPSPTARRRLGQLTPVLAHGVDPLRSMLTAARLVRGATAGTVLYTDGSARPLPGLRDDALLVTESPVVLAARERLGGDHVYTTFLWPQGGLHAPQGHVRITALAPTDDVPTPLDGIVLLSPPGDLRGITPRELEVLGLLVDGCSNQEIARALVVAPRTVAAHLEHILVKLDAPTRTLAAVRAERDGLYVPGAVRTRPPEPRAAPVSRAAATVRGQGSRPGGR